MINHFIVLLTGLNLSLIIIFLALNYPDIRKQFSRIKKTTWFILLIILLFGTSLRAITPHHHMMFIDEYWTMEASRNIVLIGSPDTCEYVYYEQISCTPYMKLMGTPLLFSISFLLFGINNYHAIYMSVILGSLSIILMFMLSYFLIRREDAALYSSLIFATYPLYIMWSGSASTNIPGIFFFLLTLVSFTLYFRIGTYKAYFLFIMTLSYAIQTKIELAVLFAIILFMYMLFDKKIQKKIRNSIYWDIRVAVPIIISIFSISLTFKITALLSGTLMIFFLYYNGVRKWIRNPMLWAIYSVFLLFLISLYVQMINYSRLLIPGDFTTGYSASEVFRVISEGITGYESGIISGLYFSYPIILLSILGAVFLTKHNKRALFTALSIFLIFSYIFIIAGIDKILLFAYPGLILLSASGAVYLTDLLKSKLGRIPSYITVTMFLLLIFFPFISPYYNTPITDRYTIQAKALETHILEEAADIPGNCYVAMIHPTVLTTTDIKTIRLNTILDNPVVFDIIYNKTGCVLFYEDLGCYIEKSSTDEGCVFFFDNLHDYDYCLRKSPILSCENIKKLYNTEVFREYTLGNFTYTLYSLSPA